MRSSACDPECCSLTKHQVVCDGGTVSPTHLINHQKMCDGGNGVGILDFQRPPSSVFQDTLSASDRNNFQLAQCARTHAVVIGARRIYIVLHDAAMRSEAREKMQ